MFSSVIGNGWKPVVLDTQEEYDFIKKVQTSFNNSVHYWIGGSTNVNVSINDVVLNFTNYIGNNSGNYHNDIIWMYLT